MINAVCKKHSRDGSMVEVTYSYSFQSCPICDDLADLEEKIDRLNEKIGKLEKGDYEVIDD